jgi:hypothetical protein
MFENQMFQMYDTREIEMPAGLGMRRVDLVPPLHGHGMAWVTKLGGALRSLRSRPQTRRTPSTAPSVPWH